MFAQTELGVQNWVGAETHCMKAYLLSDIIAGQPRNEVQQLVQDTPIPCQLAPHILLTFDPLFALLNPFLVLFAVIAGVLFLRLAKMGCLGGVATCCEGGRVQCVSAEIPHRS